MKKTFSFKVPNKNRDRQTDSIKYEVKKYIARERRKKLPEDVPFWDFNCRIGVTQEESEVIYLSAINKSISHLSAEGEESFYLEILVKPGVKKKEV